MTENLLHSKMSRFPNLKNENGLFQSAMRQSDNKTKSHLNVTDGFLSLCWHAEHITSTLGNFPKWDGSHDVLGKVVTLCLCSQAYRILHKEIRLFYFFFFLRVTCLSSVKHKLR